jgi:C-terminal region of aryl-sulfatase
VTVRYGNWKIVFAEQKTPGTLDIWGEPFTFRRFPLIFNLRMDPYERAQITSNSYWDWTIHKAYLLMGAQAIVAAFIGTFQEFPPAQRPQSFSVDQIMEKLQQPTND